MEMNEQGFAPSPPVLVSEGGAVGPLCLVPRASPCGSKRPLWWAEKGDALHLTYWGNDAGHDHPASPQLIMLDTIGTIHTEGFIRPSCVYKET